MSLFRTGYSTHKKHKLHQKDIWNLMKRKSSHRCISKNRVKIFHHFITKMLLKTKMMMNVLTTILTLFLTFISFAILWLLNIIDFLWLRDIIILVHWIFHKLFDILSFDSFDIHHLFEINMRHDWNLKRHDTSTFSLWHKLIPVT